MVFLEMMSRRELDHGKSIGKNSALHQSPLQIPLTQQPFLYFRLLSSPVKTNSPKASGTWKFGTAVPVGLHAA